MTSEKYDLSQQPIPVTASPEQTQKIIEFADLVNVHYAEHGVGWETTYRFHVNPIRETSIMGFLGEAVVAEVLGLEFREELFDNGDFGWDNEYGDLRVQVKCGSGKQLIMRNLEHWKPTADVVVFAEYLGDRRVPHENPSFEVWGWLSKKDFLRMHKWRHFADKWPDGSPRKNAYVDCWNLRPLSTLSKYKTKVPA